MELISVDDSNKKNSYNIFDNLLMKISNKREFMWFKEFSIWEAEGWLSDIDIM